MKRLLLATTAVAGLALVAPAQAAEPITVTLGGTFEFYSGWRDTDRAGVVDHDFRVDPEILINSKGKADNGLEYGVKWEIETGDTGRGMRTDEVVGYVSGSFGRLEFGDEDGAADRLAIFAPVVGFSQIDGDYDVFALMDIGELRGNVTFHKPFDSDDHTKVTYFTPKFAGFQAGVSYSAQQGSANEADSVTATASTPYDSVIELGAQYAGEFSGVGIKGSAGFTRHNGTQVGVNDIYGYSFGGQVSYVGVTIGGSYVNQGGVVIATPGGAPAGANLFRPTGTPVTAKLDDSFDVGISYVNGPVGVSFNYASASTNRDTDIDAYFLGASYTVAPGLVVAADLVFQNNEVVDLVAGGTQQDDEQTIFMVGTILSF